MQYVPFRNSHHARAFADAGSARRYDVCHGRRAARLGAVFARMLAEAGPSPRRILDAGSAGGHTAFALAEAFPQAEVVGLDLCEPLLELARASAEARHLAARVTFVRGDVQAMPFDDDSFDAVVSADVLHCVDDPAAMLNECERVLAPGGSFLLRNIRRCWLGWLDAVFRTAYTAAEVKDILRASKLRPWRLASHLISLEIQAGPRTTAPYAQNRV